MIFYNFIFAITVSVSLLLHEIFLGYIANIIKARISVKEGLTILCLSFFLSLNKSKKYAICFFLFLYFMQVTQINHLLYFGIPIHTGDISKVFVEGDEIFSSGLGAFNRVWPGFVTLLLSCVLIIIAYKFKEKCKVIRLIPTFLSLLILVFPCMIAFKGVNSFPPHPNSTTLFQSYRSFSMWAIYGWRPVETKNYLPYSYKTKLSHQKNIIFILGESTNTRYASLYGYKENTTPFLQGLDSQVFAYTKGLSCSTSTKTSLPLFFNLVREPQNLELIDRKTVNLFRLAKEQGYRTTLIAGQNPKLFYNCGTEFIDETINLQNEVKTDKRADYVLIDAFNNIKLDEKNFIVIHLRHVHSPYNCYVQEGIQFSAETVEKKYYCHAIFWHDQWLQVFIETVNKKMPKETITLFTSDHGELLGEEGIFGHTILHPLVSDVPIWAYSRQSNNVLNWIKKMPYISHYELGVKMAEFMGIKINNPNEDAKTYYVHSANLYTEDFQSLTWVRENNKVTFLPVNIH